MKYREAGSGDPVISELSHKIDDNHVVLRWLWPEGVTAVYIDRLRTDEPQDSLLQTDRLKLYTREEYKAAGSYRDRIEGIGRIRYTVYPSTREDNLTVLLQQTDGANSLELSTGKAKIRYAVHHKKALFRNHKTVQIQVTSEIPIPTETLCYVKKRGGYPMDKEDGTYYPFTMPFSAGRNVLPPIEVGKNEYVRLFFVDRQKYGRIYDLIPE